MQQYSFSAATKAVPATVAPLRPVACAARALMLGLCFVVPLAGMLHVPQAHAQQNAARSFAIAPGPLGTVLSNFAAAADITLSFDAEQTRGKASSGLSGTYTAENGLRALLAGSGLQAVHLKDGNYVLRQDASSGATSETTLPAVTVAGTHASEVPPAYAGGQVASGGSLGLLGNTSVMDSAFSQSSYTAELIRDTQAQTLGDVLESSPSLRRNGSRFNQNDTYSIRGFPTSVGNDIAYDGMYGLTNTRRNAIEGIERVEVLRGPSALLNGVPATGSIGGSINLVPKRPTAEPLTDLTLSYADASQASAHLDVSRRLGEEKRLGIRTNLAHREGDTRFDYNSEKATLASVAVDYQGDRFRLFGHLNQEDQYVDMPLFSGLGLPAGVAVPAAPDGRRNFTSRFNYTDTSRQVRLLRGEYDFSSRWTGSLGYGEQHIDETQVVSIGQNLINAQGDISAPTRNRMTQSARDGRVIDAKLRGEFETGPVKHRLAVAYSSMRFDQQIKTFNGAGGGSLTNLYHPNPDAANVPSFATLSSQVLSRSDFDGLAIADTLHFLDDRLLVTVGVRRQQIKGLTDGKVTYDRSATSPSVGVVVKPWNNWSIYGNYIEGLSQGGQAPAQAINANEIFPPFVSKQHEIGVKHDAGRMLTTVSLFQLKRPSALTDPFTLIYSVNGEQRNRGIEVESYGEIARGWRVISGFTLMEAKLVRTAGGANQGNFAPDVSRFSANLNLEWDASFLPGMTLTGRAIYTGSQYLDASNTREIPSWTRYDVGARYRFKAGNTPVTVRAGIVNVFNHKYFETTRLYPGTPRTFSLSTTFSF